MGTRTVVSLCLLTALAGGATVPRQAPEFVIQTPSTQYLLSQYRGKVVLLTFIHTTCPHCQASVAPINQVQKDFGSRGFQALGAAFNENAKQLLPEFLGRFRPEYPVGATSRESALEFLQVSSNTPVFVPIFVFIDKKGIIREQHLGNNDKFLDNQDQNTRLAIERLLSEPAQAKKPVKKRN